MNAETKDQAAINSIDEELRDVLIAISVVAKRLAKKLEEKNDKQGDIENERKYEDRT